MSTFSEFREEGGLRASSGVDGENVKIEVDGTQYSIPMSKIAHARLAVPVEEVLTMNPNDGLEIVRALDDLQRERGISKEVLLEAIEAALVQAFKRHYGSAQNDGGDRSRYRQGVGDEQAHRGGGGGRPQGRDLR